MQNSSSLRKSGFNLQCFRKHLSTNSALLRETIQFSNLSDLPSSKLRASLSNPNFTSSTKPSLIEDEKTQKKNVSFRDLQGKLQQISTLLSSTRQRMAINHEKHCQDPKRQSQLTNISLSEKQEIPVQKPQVQKKQNRNQGELKKYRSLCQLSQTSLLSPKTTPKYYISQAIRAKNQKNSLAVEHINTSIHILKECSILLQTQGFIRPPKIQLPQSKQNKHKKTLILDLDQTLVHSFQSPRFQTQFKINATIQGSQMQIGFNIRPYALSFLKKMAKNWQIIIFTASNPQYADAILDQLDPQKELFAHRLYRQHCSLLTQNIYIKDISIINRNIKDMALVDNAANSFILQLENAIPIYPFYQGKDSELSTLQFYLNQLAGAEDVRAINRNTFKLRQYHKYASADELIEALYLDSK